MLGNLLQELRQEAEQANKLEILEKELKSARILGKKHCIKCGFCCHRASCIPTPSEFKKIAKFLKLTPIELFKKYYVIDRQDYREGLGDIYYLKPAGINEKDLIGKFIPAERTFNEGKCIFLDKNNLCKIYPVRPETARKAKCWVKQKRDITPIKAWQGNQLKKQFGIDGKTKEENGI